MTVVNVSNKTQEVANLDKSIAECTPGVWYMVSDYPPNKNFVGKVGVLIQVYDSDEYVYENTLVTPCGLTFGNKAFKLKPLKSVDVTFEEF